MMSSRVLILALTLISASCQVAHTHRWDATGGGGGNDNTKGTGKDGATNVDGGTVGGNGGSAGVNDGTLGVRGGTVGSYGGSFDGNDGTSVVNGGIVGRNGRGFEVKDDALVGNDDTVTGRNDGSSVGSGGTVVGNVGTVGRGMLGPRGSDSDDDSSYGVHGKLLAGMGSMGDDVVRYGGSEDGGVMNSLEYGGPNYMAGDNGGSVKKDGSNGARLGINGDSYGGRNGGSRLEIDNGGNPGADQGSYGNGRGASFGIDGGRFGDKRTSGAGGTDGESSGVRGGVVSGEDGSGGILGNGGRGERRGVGRVIEGVKEGGSFRGSSDSNDVRDGIRSKDGGRDNDGRNLEGNGDSSRINSGGSGGTNSGGSGGTSSGGTNSGGNGGTSSGGTNSVGSGGINSGGSSGINSGGSSRTNNGGSGGMNSGGSGGISSGGSSGTNSHRIKSGVSGGINRGGRGNMNGGDSRGINNDGKSEIYNGGSDGIPNGGRDGISNGGRDRMNNVGRDDMNSGGNSGISNGGNGAINTGGRSGVKRGRDHSQRSGGSRHSNDRNPDDDVGRGDYDHNNSELRKLDQLFISRGGNRRTYDRRQTPSYSTGTPTRVHIEMYIRSFGSVNPIQMDYTVDLYLRQRWVELRFLNQSLTRPVDLSDPLLVRVLWKPEVYFPNAKESDFQYVTVPNVMLRIHPDGTILYILRLKLTFSCMMDLSSYPLDHQTCYIQIASFVKTTRELELVWYPDSPIKMYRHLKLPQFEMKDIKAQTCSQSFHIGNYSCLQAAFELRRNIGYHLVQSYLPTSLIVVVSWVSFWLDVDAIPSRVTLGVTTLLTVCSESTSFRDKMPTVSYVKALDIWMGSCTAFVFLALVEFTVVNHIARHHRRYLVWGSVYHRAYLAPSLSHAQATSLSHAHATKHAPSSPLSRTHTSSFSQARHTQSLSHPRAKHTSSSSTHAHTSSTHAKSSSTHTHTPSTQTHTSTHPQTQPQHETADPSPHTSTARKEFNHESHHSSPTHNSSSLYYPRPTSLPAHRDSLNDGVRRVRKRTSVICAINSEDVRDGGSWMEGRGCEGEDRDLPYPLTDDEDDDPLERVTRGDDGLVQRWQKEVVLAKKIDRTCRALFPVLFILFNLVYWIHYQVFT